MKVRGHTLGAWFNHLLFKLLPPRWYLRTQGIKLYREPPATATIMYKSHGEVKTTQVKFGSARAIVKIFPLWFEYGFCEPVPELSPYIPPHLDNREYYIPPVHILKVEWYDPVLKDNISIDRPGWRLDGYNR